MTYDEVVARFPGARRLADGKAEAPCPAHEDDDPSLSISAGTDGRTLVTCHAGCKREDVVAAVGLTMRDLFADDKPAKAEKSRIVATYVYRDADRSTRFEICRFFPKDFRPRRPGPDGRWLWNLTGAERIPYHLPEILAAPADAPVFAVEGEKDADALARLGLVATTNPGGCGSTKLWDTKPFRDPFAGRDVVIIPDGDEPGAKHAAHVYKALAGVARSIKIVRLSEKDVSDWLAAGHTVEELHTLTEASPEQATIINEPAQGEAVTVDAVLLPGQGPGRPARAFALTETGGAELLANRLAGDWRYCEDRKQWVRWTGQLWVFDAGDVAITERSKLVAHEFLAEAQWALKADDARAKAFAQFAATAQRRQFRRAVIDLAKSEPGILVAFSDFDCDAYLLNASNGTVDLRTGQLRPHSREDKITRILPWSYELKATCPRWESFLIEILPDAETVEFVRAAIGYSVTGDVAEHVLFSCYGAGANGKSVLLNTLLYVLGPYATTAPTSMLVAKQHESHPAEKVVLVAKRLAVFQEIPSGQRLNEALVKALVSGDPDQARGMRENFIGFRPVAKLWLAGNHRLDIREQTDAIWRRYREIPFERVFPEEQRDHGLEEKLRLEAPGILAWAVRACLDWQRRGLGKSSKVVAATADYRAEADRLAPFLDERCLVAPSASVPRAAFYQEYRAWAERLGMHAISDKAFAELMRGRGFLASQSRVNGKNTRVWLGVGLLDCNGCNAFPKDSPVPPISFPSREVIGKNSRESVAGVATDPTAPEDAV
jgi:putative DNA primase/helicase